MLSFSTLILGIPFFPRTAQRRTISRPPSTSSPGASRFSERTSFDRSPRPFAFFCLRCSRRVINDFPYHHLPDADLYRASTAHHPRSEAACAQQWDGGRGRTGGASRPERPIRDWLHADCRAVGGSDPTQGIAPFSTPLFSIFVFASRFTPFLTSPSLHLKRQL